METKEIKAIEKYNYLKNNNLILLECIVGSQAYGTNIATSDEDRKFIYIEPLENILIGNVEPQLDVNKDYVGYELGRFMELLAKQNPNINELLYAPEDTIIYKNPLFDKYLTANRAKLLSNKVRYTYAEYANTQIKKARGLNKKVVNPMPKERKTLLDFCKLFIDNRTVSMTEYIENEGIRDIKRMGVTKMDKTRDTFALYVSDQPIYKGIHDKDGVQIVFSSINKGILPVAYFNYNMDEYSKYCRDYREYWDWFEIKNPTRFDVNMQTAGDAENFMDVKNMMHCHRLLDTCIEIFQTGFINVRRPNRDELLAIRSGKVDYKTILSDADEKFLLIEQLFKENKLNLQDTIDMDLVNNIILNLRKDFYNI